MHSNRSPLRQLSAQVAQDVSQLMHFSKGLPSVVYPLSQEFLHYETVSDDCIRYLGALKSSSQQATQKSLSSEQSLHGMLHASNGRYSSLSTGNCCWGSSNVSMVNGLIPKFVIGFLNFSMLILTTPLYRSVGSTPNTLKILTVRAS